MPCDPTSDASNTCCEAPLFAALLSLTFLVFLLAAPMAAAHPPHPYPDDADGTHERGHPAAHPHADRRYHREWRAVGRPARVHRPRMQIGFGAGYFAPWQGRGGEQLQFEVLGRNASGHLRWGGEFVHRRFDTRFFGVDDVGVDNYQANVLMHFVANPGAVSPYIGGGIGVHVNDIRSRDVTSASALVVGDDVGVGYGLFGVIGIEAPVGDFLSFFVEGRLNLAGQATGTNDSAFAGYVDHSDRRIDDHDFEDLGGGSAIAGVRLAF